MELHQCLLIILSNYEEMTLKIRKKKKQHHIIMKLE